MDVRNLLNLFSQCQLYQIWLLEENLRLSSYTLKPGGLKKLNTSRAACVKLIRTMGISPRGKKP